MSGIIEVYHGNDGTGAITCEARLLDYREAAVPGAYSYIGPGVSTPVLAGDIYDVWEFKGSKVPQAFANKLYISGHGTFIGPMIFVKRDPQNLYAHYVGKVVKRLADYGLAIGATTAAVGCFATAFGIVLVNAIGVSILITLLIGFLISCLAGTLIGLGFSSSLQGAPHLIKVSIRSVVPVQYIPKEVVK